MSQTMKALRIVITGNVEASCAAVEILMRTNEYSLVRIPAVGDCVRAGMRPQLWHTALSSMMHCHPGAMLFTGGQREDHEWIVQRRGLLLNISDRLAVEVSADFDERSPRWGDYSPRSLSDKIRSAIEICNMVSREPKAHTVPPVYRYGT